MIAVVLVGLAAGAHAGARAPAPPPWVPPANATLMNHKPVLDASGRLVPWPTEQDPFTYLYDIAWRFWEAGVPNQPGTGFPLWYFYGSWTPGKPTGADWPATPASSSLFVAEAAVAQLAYTGNRSAVDGMAVPFSRYVLANGTTPPEWLWGSMPFASSDPGALVFRGANSTRFGGNGRGDGIGVVEPDKAADAGKGFVLLANATSGDTSEQFRRAAVAVADTLAKTVRAPPLCNATHSPWPFRVHAQTGDVVEEYTANVVSALNLFDSIGTAWADPKGELTLADGTTLPRARAHARARDVALAWQAAAPEVTQAWTACCEDVPVDNTLTNFNSVQTLFAAQYIITRRLPGWAARAQKILDFVAANLIFTSNGPRGWHPPEPLPVGWAGEEWGARCVAEQKEYLLKMGIHTARYATAVGMLHEALGGTNATLGDIARRSFAWASYCTQESGVNLVGPGELNVWMIQAMMLAPAGAPSSDHMLLSFPIGLGASVPSSVTYAKGRVSWTSSSVPSTDRLRVTFTPAGVTAGGKPLPKRANLFAAVASAGGASAEGSDAGWWTHDPATGLVVVQHEVDADVMVAGVSE